MKKFSLTVMALGLLLMPWMLYAQPEQPQATPPPVAPTLIREGDFAIELVRALNMGTATNEAEAEAMLATSGIAPKNGWISDYPVTPDIIAELQATIGDAADANRLPTGRENALTALQNVQASLDMAVVPDTTGRFAESPPPTTPQYTDPGVINNYYYEQGPPVVTYYPPPPDYYYLYSWVPYPFWGGAYFFPGFFILCDFHRSVHFHNRVVVVSNHVFDRHRNRFFSVDPVGRRWGNSLRPGRRTFEAGDARRGAESIYRRSQERRQGNLTASRPDVGFRGRTGTDNGGMPSVQGDPRGNRAQFAPREGFRGAAPDRRSQGRSFTPPSAGGRNFSGGGTFERGSQAFNGRGGGMTLATPGETFRRSGERAQVAPREGFRGGASDRGFSGGIRGNSRGFSGGFSGAPRGGGFGGSHGRSFARR